MDSTLETSEDSGSNQCDDNDDELFLEGGVDVELRDLATDILNSLSEDSDDNGRCEGISGHF
jgi:hypothetical protein